MPGGAPRCYAFLLKAGDGMLEYLGNPSRVSRWIPTLLILFALYIFQDTVGRLVLFPPQFPSTSSTCVSSSALASLNASSRISISGWCLRGFPPLEWKNLAVSRADCSATGSSSALRISSATSFAELCLHAIQPENVEPLEFWFEMTGFN